jgi:hypothetical protein
MQTRTAPPVPGFFGAHGAPYGRFGQAVPVALLVRDAGSILRLLP